MFYTKLEVKAMVSMLEAEHKSLIKKVHSIWKLAIEKSMKTNYGVFFNYSGHVECVSVRIYKTKEAKPDEQIFYNDWIILKKPSLDHDYQWSYEELIQRHKVVDLYINKLKSLK